MTGGHRQIEKYAASNNFPLWWSELACTTMAEAMVVFPTPKGKEFARNIKRYADSLREDGFGDRWGVDQVAIYTAERRLEGAIVHRLNTGRKLDIATTRDAAIWYPHPHQREDKNSEWSIEAAKLMDRVA